MTDEESPSQPGDGAPPPNHPRAVMILVFGILGVVVLFPFGIAAWVMGSNALREIDANPAGFQGRQMVKAGEVLGIIAVVLAVIEAVSLGVATATGRIFG